MIAFREVDDADPALAYSPLVRGIEKTFAWIGEHGGIPLTPSKAFKRAFVHWAAAAFDWPGHTEADLFAVNKVLNEPDFAPLMVLHDLMIAMKLGRRYKSEFRLTKAGQALVGHPGRIFGMVVPFFLFRINHASMSRFQDAPILGNWDVFLNIETEDGATGAQLRRVLFGEPEKGPLPRYDEVMGQLYIQVLRPLCWASLLQQERGTAIRDKFAASRRKGMWMGGPVPLGYVVKDRKLVIEPTEAEQVRTIFRLYARSSSTAQVLKELHARGIRTKRGAVFDRGYLLKFLHNKVYLGLAVHKDEVYPGEHKAINAPASNGLFVF